MAELNAILELAADLGGALDDVPRLAGRAIGAMGKEEFTDLATKLWGGDRKFSNSRFSRKARRVAGVKYNLFSDRVEIQPTGDPWYIWAKGRGRHRIVVRGGRGSVRTPWGPRRSAHGGRLEPRPERFEPAFLAIQRKAPNIISDEVDKAIRRAL